MVSVSALRIVLDVGDVPSIVVPLDGSTRLPTHAHPQHQLTWAVDGVLTMEASDRRWVVQRSRALWIPGASRTRSHQVPRTGCCRSTSSPPSPRWAGRCPPSSTRPG
ncbi:hypothetical protein [Luteimicrobium album]|uniref:hypothetical protein n=1 Tax=Luteimicrobium album TaxID=1054550 RepID=UPI0024E093F7|nr:hypothetical protein [Luteimicrobium album]